MLRRLWRSIFERAENSIPHFRHRRRHVSTFGRLLPQEFDDGQSPGDGLVDSRIRSGAVSADID